MSRRVKVLIKLLVWMPFLVSCQTSGKRLGSNVKTVTLKNGVEVLFLRDSNLPYFRMAVWSPMGYAYEEKDKQGLTNLMALALEESTKKNKKPQLQKKLKKIGAEINSQVEEEQTVFYSQVLAQDSKKLVDLFLEILFSPAFDNKEILNIKEKMIAEMQNIPDSPGALSQIAFKQTVFGEHGYSRKPVGLLSTLSKIRRDDVVSRHQQIQVPQNLKVAMIGQWTEEAEAELLTFFSDMEKSVTNIKTVRESPPDSPKKNIFFHKPGLKQANVVMGLTTVPRNSSEYTALKVGMGVLAGTFISRLNQVLRVEKGLTYGVGGDLDSGRDGGVIVISGAVRHDKLKNFIESANQVIANTAKKGVTQEELDKIKNYISGQYPKIVETKEKEAFAYLDLVSKGVSPETLYSYLDEVDKLNLTQVNDALRKYVYVPRMSVVVVGDKTKAPALKNFKYSHYTAIAL